MLPHPVSRQPIPPEAKKVFSGVMFDVYQWPQKMFDGTVETFEKLKRKDIVSILPITPAGDILLCQQEQPATTPFLSVVGGRVDDGETAEKAARRELLEETGFACEELVPWYAEQSFGAKIDAVHTVFFAYGCQKIAEQELDAGEKITLLEVSFSQLVHEVVYDPYFRNTDIALHILREYTHPSTRDAFIAQFRLR